MGGYKRVAEDVGERARQMALEEWGLELHQMPEATAADYLGRAYRIMMDEKQTERSTNGRT